MDAWIKFLRFCSKKSLSTPTFLTLVISTRVAVKILAETISRFLPEKSLNYLIAVENNEKYLQKYEQ